MMVRTRRIERLLTLELSVYLDLRLSGAFTTIVAENVQQSVFL